MVNFHQILMAKGKEMKIKTVKKVIGWFLVFLGLLLLVASPFSFYIPTTEDVMLQDAVGVFICLLGIWILIRAAKGKEISN